MRGTVPRLSLSSLFVQQQFVLRRLFQILEPHVREELCADSYSNGCSNVNSSVKLLVPLFVAQGVLAE